MSILDETLFWKIKKKFKIFLKIFVCAYNDAWWMLYLIEDYILFEFNVDIFRVLPDGLGFILLKSKLELELLLSLSAV